MSYYCWWLYVFQFTWHLVYPFELMELLSVFVWQHFISPQWQIFTRCGWTSIQNVIFQLCSSFRDFCSLNVPLFLWCTPLYGEITVNLNTLAFVLVLIFFQKTNIIKNWQMLSVLYCAILAKSMLHLIALHTNIPLYLSNCFGFECKCSQYCDLCSFVM